MLFRKYIDPISFGGSKRVSSKYKEMIEVGSIDWRVCALTKRISKEYKEIVRVIPYYDDILPQLIF